MSESSSEFPFDEYLQNLTDEHKRKLEKFASLQQTFCAKIKDISIAHQMLAEDYIDDVKRIRELEKLLATLNEMLVHKRNVVHKLRTKQENLTDTINKTKAETVPLKSEVNILKKIDPLLECYNKMFDLNAEINMVSEGVYKVSIKFVSNSEMAPVVITLNLPKKQILKSTDNGDIPLENYTKKLGNYFLYLCMEYSKKCN